ncbi:response regulator transcription factor [Lactonifactor longoviformis]|uniref:response regulator transcription factor n=1 Tax=Lactonifactor longoviformis TaxID=341220 RepID=UPI0036F2B9D3
MVPIRELPWEYIHRFLLSSGSIHEQRQFCEHALRSLNTLVPYDQARLLYIDKCRYVSDVTLLGVEKWWWDMYMGYYSKIEDSRYFIRNKSVNQIHVYDWSMLNGEFVRDYVRPQGLRYSTGFGLTDRDGGIQCVFCLDRTSVTPYTERELAVLEVLRSHLENLYRGMQASEKLGNERPYNPVYHLLTPREQEIARLLCDGKVPGEIGKILYISVATVYCHLRNIHSKLHVSSRQELILRLMN